MAKVTMSVDNLQPAAVMLLNRKINAVVPLFNRYWPKAMTNNGWVFEQFRLLPFDKTHYINKRCHLHLIELGETTNVVNLHWPKVLLLQQ